MVNLLVHLDKGGEGSMRWINVSLMIVSMARNMVKSPMWISSLFFCLGTFLGETFVASKGCLVALHQRWVWTYWWSSMEMERIGAYGGWVGVFLWDGDKVALIWVYSNQIFYLWFYLWCNLADLIWIV
jgi:hypothetical protein